MTSKPLSRQSWSVVEGDCIAVMAAMDEASVDAIVCDPPYGLEFMGKGWDRPWAQHFTAIGDGPPLPDRQLHVNPRCKSCGGYQRGTRNPCRCGDPQWSDSQAAAVGRKNRDFQDWCTAWGIEALRVLKAGGYLLAFGGTRTYHRLVSGLEDAGFEVRDQVAWIYGSGFPKHPACLKPAQEPVVLARKASRYSEPLQIDAARIEAGERPVMVRTDTVVGANSMSGQSTGATASGEVTTLGRWPANVVLDPGAAAVLDEQSGTSASRIGKPRGAAAGDGWGMTATGTEYDDAGGASRFFYVAKPDTAERNVGLHKRNPHPTVKPVELMRWLCRLVTPPGGTVLDPFTGSGTTGIAAMREGFSFVGIEQDTDYARVARARIVGDAPLINGALEEAA